MKNSNEWIKDIKEKAENRVVEQKRRRKIIASVSSSIACLALILCSAFILPNMLNGGLSIGADSSGATPTLNNSTTSQHTNNSDSQVIAPPSSDKQPDQPSSSIPGISSETQNPNNPTSAPSTEPSKPNVIPVDFTVNRITGQISAARLYRDPAEHYEETWTRQQMMKYLGVNLTQLSSYMPKDLVYAELDSFTVIFHNSGNIVEDLATFAYRGNDGRSLTVSASKTGKPYDYLYSLETSKTEKINGNEVLIGGMLKSEGSNEYGFFYADFENQGISYRVKANHLTGEEFYKAVQGITGLK
ncbi:MAG: hypothetical protein HFE39_07720 [Clostridiales bacterium]|jgi:hypothetical protein|nr:hypothetical protein [Clostridiales bacterium]